MHLKTSLGLSILLLNTWAYAAMGATGHTIKLKPQIRVSAVPSTTQMVPLSVIQPFLKTSLILEDERQFLQAPYVIAQDKKRIEGEVGSMLYVRKIPCATEECRYTLYRAGKLYTHPRTCEKLGFEAFAIGMADLKMPGDPAEMRVVRATEGIEVGTRLFASADFGFPDRLEVRPAPRLREAGYILSVRDGLNQIGRNQVVVLSLGKREGIRVGNTLEIYQRGEEVLDPDLKGWRPCKVRLPDKRVGRLLVFQTYRKLSVALVLEATEVVQLLDRVKSS